MAGRAQRSRRPKPSGRCAAALSSLAGRQRSWPLSWVSPSKSLSNYRLRYNIASTDLNWIVPMKYDDRELLPSPSVAWLLIREEAVALERTFLSSAYAPGSIYLSVHGETNRWDCIETAFGAPWIALIQRPLLPWPTVAG